MSLELTTLSIRQAYIYIYIERERVRESILHSTNTLVKGMNLIILPPVLVNSRADCSL